MPRFLLLAALLAASSASAQTTHSGTLEPGDETLTSGEFVDEYAVTVRPGETVSATVSSSDFDTYVLIKDANERQEDNDDCTEGNTDRSCIAFTADAAGTVRVLVTSYGVGETGRYEVQIVTSRGTLGIGGAPKGATL